MYAADRESCAVSVYEAKKLREVRKAKPMLTTDL